MCWVGVFRNTRCIYSGSYERLQDITWLCLGFQGLGVFPGFDLRFRFEGLGRIHIRGPGYDLRIVGVGVWQLRPRSQLQAKGPCNRCLGFHDSISISVILYGNEK